MPKWMVSGVAGLGGATTVTNLGNVTGNVTCNLAGGSTVFVATITGPTTFTFTGWPTGSVATEPTVIAVQDAIGHPISFAGITWLPLGASPLFQTGAGQVNITGFFSTDNGATVYGQGGSLSGGGFGVYGDGTDGAVSLDGTNTYPGLFGKSGNFYWALRDLYLSSCAIGAGVTLQLGGGTTPVYRLTCTGTVSLGTGGFISTLVGTSATGATGGTNLTTGTVRAGANGPNGGTGPGANGTNVNGQSGGFAGRGGSSGTGNAAGANGVAVMPAGYSLPRALPAAANIAAMGPNITGGIDFFPGGASGSAGGGDGVNAGGGGGPGGNPLYIAAQNLVNNGTIQAVGGNGGNATGGSAGGGGGGQGGPIVLIYGTYSGAGTILSRGGTGGTGATTGNAGQAGGPSWIVRLVN